jgi:hypothetical protein
VRARDEGSADLGQVPAGYDPGAKPDVRAEYAGQLQGMDGRGRLTNDRPLALSPEEFDSLREVSKGDAQREIPQLHWERLVGLGYAVRRLGELGLTASGIRRLAAAK